MGNNRNSLNTGACPSGSVPLGPHPRARPPANSDEIDMLPGAAARFATLEILHTPIIGYRIIN